MLFVAVVVVSVSVSAIVLDVRLYGVVCTLTRLPEISSEARKYILLKQASKQMLGKSAARFRFFSTIF